MATLAATIGRGTLAARPSTMPAGSLYYVTDTSTLYRSTGSAWESIEAAVAAGYTAENARDDIGAALVAGAGITITPSDPGDTITIAATGAVVGTHSHTGADVTDFAEVADDRIASLLVAGSGITLTYNDAANTLTVAASGGGGGGSPATPKWTTGRYYGFDSILPSQMRTFTVTANRLYAMPFTVPGTTTVDRIVVQVATAATGNARLGIYTEGSNGLPGALLLDAGAVSTSTTGLKSITISQTLAAGSWYYLVYVSDNTPTVWGYDMTYLPGYLGVAGPDESAGIAPTSAVRSFTYGALPDPFGTILGYVDDSVRVLLRAT